MSRSLADGPHPDLVPYLSKHGLTWAEFVKRGRPKPGVSLVASENGWVFAIWTEKDVLKDALCNAA